MASYLEFQDFAVNSVCGSKLLAEQLVDVQTLGANIEEIWQKFDTPPLSPERDSDEGSSSASSESGSLETREDDFECQEKDQKLLDELLACHQLLSANYSGNEEWSGTSFTVADFPQLQSNLLIQDCMWNSQMYEPRHQICTPAPSPPPSPQKLSTVEPEMEEVEVPQADCVGPAAVFAIASDQAQASELPEQSEENQETGKQERDKERRSVLATVNDARVQPQAQSESGELCFCEEYSTLSLSFPYKDTSTSCEEYILPSPFHIRPLCVRSTYCLTFP